MLEKLIAWIKKNLGEMEVGDYMDLTHRVSKEAGQQGGAEFIITEIRITVNKKSISAKDLSLVKFRRELDKISENSIHKLDFMSSDAMRFAPEKAVKEKKAPRDTVYGESAVMMKLNIVHRRRIQNG